MSRIQAAVVLAAGRGTRMGGLTADVPKPMLPVDGRPILEHVLERLAGVGVERFFLVVGYRREAIEEHFANWRLPIEFRLQEPVDGTGSAARLAHQFAGDEPFLLTFGDILCGPEAYARCARTLLDNPATRAVLGVKDVDDPARGAAVYENEGVIYRIVEKPQPGTSTTRWNSAGLYAMNPVVFRYLARLEPSPRNEYELTSIFDMMLAERLELRIAPILEPWRDIGYPEDLAAVQRSEPT
jgi:UDP-N-acetylglucosamine diphosphorylase / glucose-1-phosphate thymidylyltransferase / UDP-N-acetylgalactosamine diphosphorylase / glucosamine-1-phosphate N-acetyltransferase / galactosamine-1-phosphate N-acetyltransferase